MQQCKFCKPTLPLALPHILNSCLFSFPLPSHNLGSLLLSNLDAASVRVTPQCFRFAFANPTTTPSLSGEVQPRQTSHTSSQLLYISVVLRIPQKSLLCNATPEIFSPGMASTASSQDELAALGTRFSAPCPRQQAALHLEWRGFLHPGLE